MRAEAKAYTVFTVRSQAQSLERTRAVSPSGDGAGTVSFRTANQRVPCVEMVRCGVAQYEAKGEVRHRPESGRDVKTEYSGRTTSLDPAMLVVLKAWRQESRFAENSDWVFASNPEDRPTALVLSVGLDCFHKGSKGCGHRHFRYAYDAS
jgi:hypothetical protein